MYQIIRHDKEDLFQTSVATKLKCRLVYSDLLLKAFYAYIIIKIPAVLVSSVNNRYTGLARANNRYGKNMAGKLLT